MTDKPSLLSKLLERDPEGVKAFLNTEPIQQEHHHFFGFSDEESS